MVDHYTTAWLRMVGVRILLGHSGQACPTSAAFARNAVYRREPPCPAPASANSVRPTPAPPSGCDDNSNNSPFSFVGISTTPFVNPFASPPPSSPLSADTPGNRPHSRLSGTSDDEGSEGSMRSSPVQSSSGHYYGYRNSRKRTSVEASLEDEALRYDDFGADVTYPGDDDDLPEELLDEDEFDEEAPKEDPTLGNEDPADMPRIGEELPHPPDPARPTRHPRSQRFGAARSMVIVDTSGVHEIPVAFCSCPDAPSPDLQLLQMGLYPATSRRPETAFTFRVLDHFLLTNKVCKTPAMTYYMQLRRTTNPLFPHMVPVRVDQ